MKKEMEMRGIELWPKSQMHEAPIIQTTGPSYALKIRLLDNMIKDQKEKKRKCVVVSSLHEAFSTDS